MTSDGPAAAIVRGVKQVIEALGDGAKKAETRLLHETGDELEGAARRHVEHDAKAAKDLETAARRTHNPERDAHGSDGVPGNHPSEKLPRTDVPGEIADAQLPGASPWSLGWSKRGYTIEEKLGGWGDNTPTIDKMPDGVATSIKSIDLAGKSYQDAARLESRLRNYAKKVQDFDGTVGKRTKRVITSRDIEGRALQVAVQPGVMSKAQRTTFDKVIEEFENGHPPVQIVVTEVP